MNLSDLLNSQPDPGFGPEDKLTFGKWKGMTIRYVIEMAPGYIEWAMEEGVILLNKEALDLYYADGPDIGDGLPF